jgi:hypothetical protein
MPGTIFISYRRGDEPGFAHALYARLEQAFSAKQLFMGVEGGIPAGADFVEVLEVQVGQCDVLLALIGQDWLTASDNTGARRLDSPDDFVRIEIESALRTGKRVIPVLVNKAEIPPAADLPGPLQPLARRNAVRLTQERFKVDVQGLIAALQGALREAEAAYRIQELKGAPTRRSLLYGGGAIGLAAVGGGVVWMLQQLLHAQQSDGARYPQRPARCSQQRPSRDRSSPSSVNQGRSKKSVDPARRASPSQSLLGAPSRSRAWQAYPSGAPS